MDADLKSYFDTIPQEKLLARVAGKVSDGRVLNLVQAYLQQGVLEEAKYWIPEKGTPQGGVSPVLSNIYLDPLDHPMAAQGVEMVRYADDFVLFCRTEGQAQAALTEVHNGGRRRPNSRYIPKRRASWTPPSEEALNFLGITLNGA